jgi:hypothetical protein
LVYYNIHRKDEKEIGPLYKGKGEKAREEYMEGISKVLKNMFEFLKNDANIFIVANDKFNLYPIIFLFFIVLLPPFNFFS